MTHSIGSIISTFFNNYLSDIRGLSEQSLASYSDCIKLLLVFTASKLNRKVEKLNVEDITDSIIIDFLNYLEAERGNGTRTRNQRLAVIKSLFHFIASKFPGMIEIARKISAIKSKKYEKKAIQPLYENELNAIFSAITTTDLNGMRDLAMFRLMYNTGARVQEIVNIRLRDIRMEAPYSVKIHGKGNKNRIVVLFPETVTAIQDYIKMRIDEEIESEFLFLNKCGTQITRQGVNYTLTKYVKIAAETTETLKGRNISPHTIRHTTAFHLIKAGNDIVVVKDWLGHEDINTSASYVTIDNQMKKEALEKINIFNKIKNESKRVVSRWKLPKVLDFLRNLSRKKPVLCKAPERNAEKSEGKLIGNFT